jgi:hypothetical protein
MTTDTSGARAALVRELDDAFRNRALVTWEIYRELRAELGAERAAAIVGRALERRGAAAGAALFARLPARTPAAVADAFLAVSPDGGRLFPHEVRHDADGAVHIKVTRCPLKDAWVAAGLGGDELATICRIAGRFDTGCFGAAGIGFAADTWTPGSAGCCHLHLLPAAPAAAG